MSNVIALSKIFIKNIVNSIYKDNKINQRTIGFALLIGVSFLPIVVSLLRFLNYIYDVLSPINQEGVLLSIGFFTSGLAILFLGLFYIIGTFYFSEDIETLLPLPLRSYEIISAKFLVVVIYEYITALVILAPALFVYGNRSGEGIAYYILSVITFLIFPIIPLALSSIIVMLIMRFSNIAKNKDMFKLFGGIVALAVGLSINIIIQKAMNGVLSNPERLQSLLLEGNNSLMNAYSFPGLKYLTYALLNNSTVNGILNFGIFIVITLGLFAIFLFVAEKLYFKGVIGISEAGSKKRKLSKDQLSKGSFKRSAVLSYTLKELRILFRTPIYFLNCVLITFILPILLIIPAISQQDGFSALSNILNSYSLGMILIFGFSFTVIITSMNAVTATSISREGHNYFISKFIPISYRDQILAKVLSGVILGLTGTAIMLLTVIIVFRINLYVALLILIIGILGVTFGSMLGIAIDLYNPKLNWDSEQKAVKQNLNVVLHMFFGTIFAGGTIYLGLKLKLALGMTILGLIFSYGALNVLIYRFLITKGVQFYSQISD